MQILTAGDYDEDDSEGGGYEVPAKLMTGIRGKQGGRPARTRSAGSICVSTKTGALAADSLQV